MRGCSIAVFFLGKAALAVEAIASTSIHHTTLESPIDSSALGGLCASGGQESCLCLVKNLVYIRHPTHHKEQRTFVGFVHMDSVMKGWLLRPGFLLSTHLTPNLSTKVVLSLSAV